MTESRFIGLFPEALRPTCAPSASTLDAEGCTVLVQRHSRPAARCVDAGRLRALGTALGPASSSSESDKRSTMSRTSLPSSSPEGSLSNGSDTSLSALHTSATTNCVVTVSSQSGS